MKSAKKDDANLAREIHHHRQFIHPHIARLYEVIVTETLVWLVLEYVSGDELYNHLLKVGPMEPAKVQKIFTQLVGAVSYVHQKSCVHRDLKLENILLDKYENVKLVDFGFTREYEGRSSYLQTWCGTVCYSAPEMIKGEKYAGEKVDVWSLGIILYALLCGELPFDEDDENATKARILKEDPKYPEHMPEQAKDLIMKLLSKRPLHRLALADILQHPWLAEHAPQQQAILKLQQPAPFTTELEKDTLQRMKSAGVDIDMVIENVLAQRCDSLAGWWALLIEKEEKKARRRERKRKEREAEAKSLRRLSAASSRLERIAPTIKEADEESHSLRVPMIGDPPRTRGRARKRSSMTCEKWPIPDIAPPIHRLMLVPAPSDLPKLPETTTPESPTPPPPIEKDAPRSTSSSRVRPPLPPKEHRVSRTSMLQYVQSSSDLPNGTVPHLTRKKFQNPLLTQLNSIKTWFKDTATLKRGKSPNQKKNQSPSHPQSSQRITSAGQIQRPGTVRRMSTSSSTYRYSNSHMGTATATRSHTYPQRPSITTTSAGGVSKPRPSLSPSPLTPHSSYRRSSAGLRGRKSTSSSVSSIRSMPNAAGSKHHHSLSKASSTSSTSLASPTSTSTSLRHSSTRSPHSSVKVLPATPTTSATFPSNIRVVRAPSVGEAANAFGAMPPPSPGLSVFARRKRNVFKGPMLSLPLGGAANSVGSRSDRGSRSGSVQGRPSGEIIEEEDEDEVGGLSNVPCEEEYVEEVEEFSPIKAGETVEVLGSEEERTPTVGAMLGSARLRGM